MGNLRPFQVTDCYQRYHLKDPERRRAEAKTRNESRFKTRVNQRPMQPLLRFILRSCECDHTEGQFEGTAVDQS
jgi:hypothetical protein